MKFAKRKKMLCLKCSTQYNMYIFRTSLGTTKAVCMLCRTTEDYVPTHVTQPKPHGRLKVLERLRLKGLSNG